MLTHTRSGAQNPIEEYLVRVRQSLQGVPPEEQDRLLGAARARIDLELELAHLQFTDEGGVRLMLARLGEPEALAQHLRSEAEIPAAEAWSGRLAPCRSCRREVSRDAMTCPHCGAPKPAEQGWNGTGYEWKSKQTLFGLPLVHVAAGRDARGKLRVAKGIIAIGQFAVGGIVIAQFGVGAVFGLGQFVAAPISVGQIAFGLAAIGQFAIGLLFGMGMIATGWKAIGLFTLQKLFRH